VRFGATGVQLRVVPHPHQQQVFLEVIGVATGEQWQVSVHSMDGREILQSTPLEQILTLNLPNLPHGVYAVWLRDARGQVVDVRKMVW
jgi:hypothetical protein